MKLSRIIIEFGVFDFIMFVCANILIPVDKKVRKYNLLLIEKIIYIAYDRNKLYSQILKLYILIINLGFNNMLVSDRQRRMKMEEFMKTNDKIKCIIISLVMLCCGFLIGTYKNENDIVYKRIEKNILDFNLITHERYGIVYDTHNRNSYLVKIDNSGFDDEMYCLGNGTFAFGEYDVGNMVIFNEEKEYIINDSVTIKESTREIEDLCMVKLSYNRDENYINVMSYKNNALCKIPIIQSAEYVIVDIIDLAR